MQITRHQHLRYMAKITPLLIFLYALQIVVYQKFGPAHMVGDVSIFLGIGLAVILFIYHFYDHHHQVIFHNNYLEVSFNVLRMKEEIIYQNITRLEMKQNKKAYGKVILHLKNGNVCELHHIDSPELVMEFIQKKKFRQS